MTRVVKGDAFGELIRNETALWAPVVRPSPISWRREWDRAMPSPMRLHLPQSPVPLFAYFGLHQGQ